MDKRYDRTTLIHAYIATKAPPGHDDVARFTAARLAALEQAFDLRLTWEGVTNQDNRALWMLFTSTVRSYLSIRTPGSDFLDGSLLMRRLDALGDDARPLMAAWETITTATTAREQAHLTMLDELFRLLWGEITTVVTSDQLRALGFDDAHEPTWLDSA
ncbi:hypothetical protein Haur_5259 (plasmid) [Herpetosiphon aurantiacus DSM 785]|uniref:Uncharacterized protein n=1 Tax=Herpetosiphon aurantiacus (strain ATCC 23779 / DSM 785 / 114-95) TaxID=316274 RepID=A9B972_HERA2|nr:hypothetical protein Haur_5259 [Herpetosiphon aurantiacus DSM 785]